MDCEIYYDNLGLIGTNQGELSRFDRTFPFILKEGNLLDAGCGEGYWLDYLYTKTKLNLYGIDISGVRINSAKEKASNKIRFNQGDIMNLIHEDNSFDQVTAMEVIEHLPDWKKGLSEVVRVASKRAVITVPYNERLKHERCINCGEEAYLYGHLSSFTEEDFRDFNFDITFHKLQPAFEFNHYLQRAFKGIFSKAKHTLKFEENGHESITICPGCYGEVKYTKYFERMTDRMSRIIKKSPEWLLIQIDK